MKSLRNGRPEEKDQDEIDFSAIDIDTEKAKREKAKIEKRKGVLLECIRERIEQREWNKDSNKRARLRIENKETEERRKKWNEAQRTKLVTKRKSNFILDDKQETRKPSKRRREIMVVEEKKKKEKTRRTEMINRDKGKKRKKEHGMERWGERNKVNEKDNRRKRKTPSKERPDKQKQPKITNFVTGNTQPAPVPKKKRPRPENRRKVSRKELLIEVLEITQEKNVEKREESEKRWGRSFMI